MKSKMEAPSSSEDRRTMDYCVSAIAWNAATASDESPAIVYALPEVILLRSHQSLTLRLANLIQLKAAVKYNIYNDSCTIWTREGEGDSPSICIPIRNAHVETVDLLIKHLSETLKTYDLLNVEKNFEEDGLLITPTKKTLRFAFSPNLSAILGLTKECEKEVLSVTPDLYRNFRTAVLVCSEADCNFYTQQIGFPALGVLTLEVDKQGRIEDASLIHAPSAGITNLSRLSQFTLHLRSLAGAKLCLDQLSILAVIRTSTGNV